MEKEIKVSVIVPVYNVEKYLGICLDSITKQTLKEIEIICVNDGSTDNSFDILENRSKEDTRIVIFTQKNKKLGGARNTGMREAKGDYIAFVDSDDWIAPDFLEKLYNAAKKHDADMSCTSVVKFSKEKEEYRNRFIEEKVFYDKSEMFEICECPPCFYVWNKLYRRLFLLEHHLFFKEFVVYEDAEYSTLALIKANKIVTVPDTCYHYRRNPSSITKSKQTKKMQLDKYNALKAFLGIIDEYDIKIKKRYRSITKRIFTFFGITIFKIRDNGKDFTYLLFDIIPVYYRKIK